MKPRDASGQTMVLVIGLALVAFGVAGIAVDGTRAFLHRRTLQNAADGAAVAGSGEIDLRSYYESGGRLVELDPASAEATARAWLQARGVDALVAVVADERGVVVVVRGHVRLSLLSLVGLDRIPVAAEARAEPVAGS